MPYNINFMEQIQNTEITIKGISPDIDISGKDIIGGKDVIYDIDNFHLHGNS